MTRTTSQGLLVFDSGDPAVALAAGLPTGDSVDAAIARYANAVDDAIAARDQALEAADSAADSVTQAQIVVGSAADIAEVDAAIASIVPLGVRKPYSVPWRDGADQYRWGAATEVVAKALGWKLPQDFGLDLTGATIHTAEQVQAWLDSGGPIYAAGTLTCSGTVTIRSDCDLHLLTWNYTGTGTAIRYGDPGGQTFRKTVMLPNLIAVGKTQNGWAEVAGSVGVQLANIYTSVGGISVGRINNFETGLLFTGVPIGAAIQGTQHVTVFPGHLDNNKVNLKVAPFVGTSQSNSGWCNQVTVLGGRLSHNSNEGVQAAGTRNVQILNCPNTVNGWNFYGTSLESPDVVEYHVECFGQYIKFDGCRWENTGGDAHRRIWSRGPAKSNSIIGGFNAGQLTQIKEPTALPFEERTEIRTTCRGGSATLAPLLIENAVSSTAPALTIMAAGAGSAGSDPATAWCVRASAQRWEGKRATDTQPRVIMDYVNGRVYVGDASAAPVAYLSASSAGLFVGGAVPFFPLANGTQDLGLSTLRWRDIYASRYVRIGSIYLRDNGGVLERSTNGTAWTAI